MKSGVNMDAKFAVFLMQTGIEVNKLQLHHDTKSVVFSMQSGIGLIATKYRRLQMFQDMKRQKKRLK